MGMPLTLVAADSHKLGAYRADPAGKPKGGVVVIQEIFGVNQHIRAVCDRVAEAGYVAVAPALFDRTVRDFQSGYTPDEIAKARKFVEAPDWDAMCAIRAASGRRPPPHGSHGRTSFLRPAPAVAAVATSGGIGVARANARDAFRRTTSDAA